MYFLKATLTVFAVFLLSITLRAANLQGKITDSESGDPVPGAMVKLVGYDYSTVTNTEGEFRLKDIPENANQLVITHISYNVGKRTFSSKDNDYINIKVEPRLIKGQDVIVTANRAERGETPAAFSNISREEIEREFWAQDTPMLLNSTPNIFSYSDAGNGLGYSYLKLRGFNQNRVSVMINGIPLNGAETHEVYWVDLPDFMNNVQDVQIQRGVGTSMYGQSALGGTINLITNDFSATPKLKVESGYGSFNTRKVSISGNSGLIKDSYVFYGRFSKIETDGYRDNSWVDMYSYFFGVARYDDNMTWKFNTYGGPEKLHLAYKGITAEQLETDRKYNEFTYANEIDSYNQPHYELFHDWKLNDNLELSNTLYYFHGDGFYNQYRENQDLAEHNLGAFYNFDSWTMYAYSDIAFPADYYATVDSAGNPLADSTGYYPLAQTTTDLVKKPQVTEKDWGWIPRLTYNHGAGKFIIGGEIRIHDSHYIGEVTWAEIYPNGVGPDAPYFDYNGNSNTFTIYAGETYSITDRLTLMANIQYQRHNYKLENDRRYNVTFDKDYDFISPRGGVNFKVNEKISTFFSVSTASRQPTFLDIYNPQDFWSNPNYRMVNFEQAGSEFAYVGPELKPEKLLDIEMGADFKYLARSNSFKGDVNLYYMQIDDELVPYAGQIDDMNLPVAGNADKTIHQGIELSFESVLLNRITFAGNFSINDDHFESYEEYDYSGSGIPIDLSGYRIGGFPEMMANYRISYRFDGLSAGIDGRYVGKQYLDNAEQHELDPYHVLDSDISYDFGKFTGVKSLIATLRVMNLLDTEYEQYGYIDWIDGMPRYMVGAERNLFVSLTAEF